MDEVSSKVSSPEGGGSEVVAAFARARAMSFW